MTDLELAFNTLTAKQEKYNRLFSYYDGDQPLVYSTRRLQEAFNKLDAKFVENWMAVVIDAVVDRLQLLRFSVSGNETSEVEINDLFTGTQLDLDSADVHLATLVTGEAFVIGWLDDDNQPQAYYNDPRMCHVFYEASNPKKKRFAAKWWIDDEGKRRITLYYPDRLEYYTSQAKSENVTKASGMIPDPETPSAPNPYNELPVFHFRRERRAICSEIEKVITLQDAINKLLADMMVTAEYGAFPQRYVISQASVGTLKNSPNEIWDLPAGDGEGQGTEVGQFSPADLKNYQEVISARATAIGIITRTPKHFFYSQGGDPSGEALIAMEAPLNDKAEAYIKRLKPVWREVMVFLMKLAGQPIDPAAVTAVFEEPATVQPATQATIRKTNVEAGIPLRTILREEGWTEAELELMDEDKAAEAEASRATVAAGVLSAMRQMDGGQQSNGLEQPVPPMAQPAQMPQ